MITGRRVRVTDADKALVLSAGDYCKIEHANSSPFWWISTPTGTLANRQAHEVVEHEDGTISVKAARDIRPYRLDRGVWMSS